MTLNSFVGTQNGFQIFELNIIKLWNNFSRTENSATVWNFILIETLFNKITMRWQTWKASFVFEAYILVMKKVKRTIQFHFCPEQSEMFTLICVVINWKHKNSFAFLIAFYRFLFQFTCNYSRVPLKASKCSPLMQVKWIHLFICFPLVRNWNWVVQAVELKKCMFGGKILAKQIVST